MGSFFNNGNRIFFVDGKIKMKSNFIKYFVVREILLLWWLEVFLWLVFKIRLILIMELFVLLIIRVFLLMFFELFSK